MKKTNELEELKKAVKKYLDASDSYSFWSNTETAYQSEVDEACRDKESARDELERLIY